MVDLGKKFERMSLIISEGTLEILQFLKERELGHFKDLRKLRNIRTDRFFSSNTVSARLKELVEFGAIRKTVSDSTGRNTVAYELTDEGEKSLELAERFEKELQAVLHKKK